MMLLVLSLAAASFTTASAQQKGVKPVVERGLGGSYIDARHLTTLPFGTHSHWLQPWRAYQETLPAQQFLDAQGIVVQLPEKENPDLIMRMLAKHGMRHARIEISWGFANYFDEKQLNHAERFKSLLTACKKHRVRPLILLNANEGVPGPINNSERILARKAGKGDREMEFTDVSDLKIGYSGLANVTQYRANEVLITGIRDKTVQLSKPLPKDLGEAGGKVNVSTLKYRPFSAPGTDDYRNTMEGWKRYVTTVAQFVTDALGTKGEADLGFDMEIWNELTFGSAFLSINNYYEPKLLEYDEHGIWRNLVRETAEHVTRHAGDYRGVTLVDGFRNTIPWPASSQQPERVGAMSFHPYPPRKHFPKDEQDGPAINALFGEDNSGFIPTYTTLFPEHSGTAIQTETAVRDLGPITMPVAGIPHGRNARVIEGKVVPCPLWFTEIGFLPKEHGFVEPMAALQVKAKSTARFTCFFVGKGLERIYFYSALSGDTDLGIVQDNFREYARTRNTYPQNDAPYVSPALQTLGRIVDRMRDELDPKLVKTRPLTVASITDEHNHFQFAGDGSRERPHLYNREVFVFTPFQVNSRRFVIPYYVMTRDLAKEFVPEFYTLKLQGVQGRTASVTAYDPIGNVPVPVQVMERDALDITVKLSAADYPRLLTIQEEDQ